MHRGPHCGHAHARPSGDPADKDAHDVEAEELVLAATATAAGPALAQSCPPPLNEALRLVLVTTPDMESSKARLQLYTRSSTQAPWTPHAGEPVKVGKNGLAWGYTFLSYKREGEPEKVEGDKRTPAGFYRLGPSFGFEESATTTSWSSPARPCAWRTPPRRYTIRLPGGPSSRRRPRPTIWATPRYSVTGCSSIIRATQSNAARAFSCMYGRRPTPRLRAAWRCPNPASRRCRNFLQPARVLGVVPETARDRFPGCLPVTVAPNE